MTITDDLGDRASVQHLDPLDVDEVKLSRYYTKGHDNGEVYIVLAGGKTVPICSAEAFKSHELQDVQQRLGRLFKDKPEEVRFRQGLAWHAAFEASMRRRATFHLNMALVVCVFVIFTILPLSEPVGTSPAGPVIAGAAPWIGGVAAFASAFSCIGESVEKFKDAVSKEELKECMDKVRFTTTYGLLLVISVIVFGFVAAAFYAAARDAATGAYREFLAYAVFYPIGAGAFSIIPFILAMVLRW